MSDEDAAIASQLQHKCWLCDAAPGVSCRYVGLAGISVPMAIFAHTDRGQRK